jgi:hypothetical protein
MERIGDGSTLPGFLPTPCVSLLRIEPDRPAVASGRPIPSGPERPCVGVRPRA